MRAVIRSLFAAAALAAGRTVLSLPAVAVPLTAAAQDTGATVVAGDNVVLFQQFTYPTDETPPGVSWWPHASEQLPELARLGVSAVWAPVPTKGGSGRLSMGYDPYDYYDLGAKNQKGTTPTRFGTKEEYLRYVAVAHANGLRVYADVVLNHADGADQAEGNPLMARLGWDDIANDVSVPAAYLPPCPPCRPRNSPTIWTPGCWAKFGARCP